MRVLDLRSLVFGLRFVVTRFVVVDHPSTLGNIFLCEKASSKENNFTSKLKLRQVGLYNSGDKFDYAFVCPEHVSCNIHTSTYLATFTSILM